MAWGDTEHVSGGLFGKDYVTVEKLDGSKSVHEVGFFGGAGAKVGEISQGFLGGATFHNSNSGDRTSMPGSILSSESDFQQATTSAHAITGAIERTTSEPIAPNSSPVLNSSVGSYVGYDFPSDESINRPPKKQFLVPAISRQKSVAPKEQEMKTPLRIGEPLIVSGENIAKKYNIDVVSLFSRRPRKLFGIHKEEVRIKHPTYPDRYTILVERVTYSSVDILDRRKYEYKVSVIDKKPKKSTNKSAISSRIKSSAKKPIKASAKAVVPKKPERVVSERGREIQKRVSEAVRKREAQKRMGTQPDGRWRIIKGKSVLEDYADFGVWKYFKNRPCPSESQGRVTDVVYAEDRCFIRYNPRIHGKNPKNYEKDRYFKLVRYTYPSSHSVKYEFEITMGFAHNNPGIISKLVSHEIED